MRTMQAAWGIIIIVVGVLILLAINGMIPIRMADIAGAALIVSGLLFVVPGFIWRRRIPWLTSLFIPGLLAIAAGVIVMYAARTGWSELWYLWIALLVALGIAFLAMYYIGPHVRWLWLVGLIVGGISLFLLALLLVLLSPLAAARIAGSAILIVLGLILAATPFIPRRPSTHLIKPGD